MDTLPDFGALSLTRSHSPAPVAYTTVFPGESGRRGQDVHLQDLRRLLTMILSCLDHFPEASTIAPAIHFFRTPRHGTILLPGWDLRGNRWQGPISLSAPAEGTFMTATPGVLSRRFSLQCRLTRFPLHAPRQRVLVRL